MKNYQLIAFDMDGTLLNSKKQITKASLDAIHRATKSDKIVILNTGRCPAELQDYEDTLTDIRYYNCLSGAMVYDCIEDEVLFSKLLDSHTVINLFDIANHEDCMVHLLNKESIVQKDQLGMMAKYQMGKYQHLFEKICITMEDLQAEYKKKPFTISKLNLYFTNPEARERTSRRIREANLPVEFAFAEETSLEISAKGIHKGVGLLNLCKELSIPISQTIAVGDADNDYLGLQTAGLAVAMGNANDKILSIADVVVSDNDSEGCAEAIDRFLLSH